MRIVAGTSGPWRLATPLCDGAPLRLCVIADPAAGEAVCYAYPSDPPQLGEPAHAVIHRGRITLRPNTGARAAILASWPELAPYLEPESA